MIKISSCFLFIGFFITGCNNNETVKTEAPKIDINALQAGNSIAKYILIKESKETPGVIDTTVIKNLSEPVLALAALYSGLGGSNCSGDSCELTTALGLGLQGSEKHKAIIAKWFPQDSAAKQLLTQDCYQPPSGASTFSNYNFLEIVQHADTVTVNYTLMYWNRGNTTILKGPDSYLLGNNQFTTLHRNIWKNIK